MNTLICNLWTVLREKLLIVNATANHCQRRVNTRLLQSKIQIYTHVTNHVELSDNYTGGGQSCHVLLCGTYRPQQGTLEPHFLFRLIAGAHVYSETKKVLATVCLIDKVN